MAIFQVQVSGDPKQTLLFAKMADALDRIATTSLALPSIATATESIAQTIAQAVVPADEVTRLVKYVFQGVSFTAKGDSMAMNVSVDQVPGTATITIAFQSQGGKPAKVDGVPAWSVSNANVVDKLTPAADGMSAEVHILDNEDATNIMVEADVDLGDGVKTKQFVDTLSVTAAEATAMIATLGPVTPDSGGGGPT
jgi:hypothetical protein